jgi:hypothetical protein
MTALKGHHDPQVTPAVYVPRWIAWCPYCGWGKTTDDEHTARVFADAHAESSLR